MLLANCNEEAKFGNAAKCVNSDIWASRSVTNVLRQFFFPAVWTGEAGLDDYPRHRPGYCSLNDASEATMRPKQYRYCRAMAIRIASSGLTR